MITIPEAFASEIIQKGGESGGAWIAALPGLIEEICNDWKLAIDSPAKFGVWGVVFAITGSDVPSVLRVSYPDINHPLSHVVRALSIWDGGGAVRLLRADLERQALLLERLDSQKTLKTLPISEAILIAGTLLRCLAVPAPLDFPQLRTISEQTARTLVARWERLDRPMSYRVIERTCDLIAMLAPSTANLIVNWDLHYENVLAAEREPWLVIDPSVVAGDPEYALAQLLWWPLEEVEAAGGVWWGLERLIEAGAFDRARAPAWTYVRTVDYWLMGLESGLTIDPVRCQRVIEALDSNPGRW